MKTEDIRITVYTYQNSDELPGQRKSLVEKAMESSKDAWAPYSGFRGGAALELANGIIVTGNNQENMAYPAGLCAERVAMFYAGARYPGVPVLRLAIIAYADGKYTDSPVYPCGECRQVLLEYENRQGQEIEVLMCSDHEIKMVKKISDLLPLPFNYHLHT